MKYFLELARKNALFGLIFMVLFVFAQCGGSDTADGDNDDDDDDDDEETELTESQEVEVAGTSQTLVNNISDVGESLSESGDGSLSALTKFDVITVDCNESGTFTIDTDSNPNAFTFDECVNIYLTETGEGSFSTDGTMTFTISGTTFTIEYDSLTMSSDPDTSATGEEGEVTFTADGGISATVDSSDDSVEVTFNDYSVVINDDDTYTVSGTLSINSSGTLTGTMTFTINTAEVTCDFSSGLDVDTATCEDYATACGFSGSVCTL